MKAGQGKLIIEGAVYNAATELVEEDGKPLDPDHNYVLSNGGGTAVWQYHDGSGWVDYPESAAGQTSILATPPPSGRVRLNVTAGPTTVNVFRRQWRS